MLETDIQNRIKLAASRMGIRLWRNNLGAFKDANGRYIRYGLANDSAQLNKIFKSSDLIGIRPVTITPDMVGQTIGQFVAREIKASDWRYRDTERERAQKAFIDCINQLGGDAQFTTGEEYL